VLVSYIYQVHKGLMQKAKSRIHTKKKLNPQTTAVILISLLITGLWGLVFYILLNTPDIEPITINHTIINHDIERDNGIDTWTGKASYYSREGCIGCSESLTMANGEPLDNNKLTVAFNKLPLGKTVRIINNRTHDVVTAEITDTGGFESLGRIIDLTPAVRDAINCSNLCDVTVLYDRN